MRAVEGEAGDQGQRGGQGYGRQDVGSFYDDWKIVTDNPGQQKQSRHFVNTVRTIFLCCISCRSKSSFARVQGQCVTGPNLSPSVASTDQRIGQK